MKMFLLYVLLFISVSEVSCQGNKEKFQPMVENIKKTIMEEVPDIKNIDTVYLLVKIMTPKEKLVIQGIEYIWASTEAKERKDPDSSYYEDTGNQLITQAGNLDSTSFLYYIASPFVIFTYNNFQKGMMQKRMFFDDDFNVILKYSIFQKISITDNLKSKPEPYIPFEPEEYARFKEIRILKYY